MKVLFVSFIHLARLRSSIAKFTVYSKLICTLINSKLVVSVVNKLQINLRILQSRQVNRLMTAHETPQTTVTNTNSFIK